MSKKNIVKNNLWIQRARNLFLYNTPQFPSKNYFWKDQINNKDKEWKLTFQKDRQQRQGFVWKCQTCSKWRNNFVITVFELQEESSIFFFFFWLVYPAVELLMKLNKVVIFISRKKLEMSSWANYFKLCQPAKRNILLFKALPTCRRKCPAFQSFINLCKFFTFWSLVNLLM